MLNRAAVCKNVPCFSLNECFSASCGGDSVITLFMNALSAGSHEAPRAEQCTGTFLAIAPWHSPDAGALSLQLGSKLWVTSIDDSGEWAYAQLVSPLSGTAPMAAWVPRAVLQRAAYPACSVFDAKSQAQGLSLGLGDLVHAHLDLLQHPLL